MTITADRAPAGSAESAGGATPHDAGRVAMAARSAAARTGRFVADHPVAVGTAALVVSAGFTFAARPPLLLLAALVAVIAAYEGRAGSARALAAAIGAGVAGVFVEVGAVAFGLTGTATTTFEVGLPITGAAAALGVLGALTACWAPDTRRFVRWAVSLFLIVLAVRTAPAAMLTVSTASTMTAAAIAAVGALAAGWLAGVAGGPYLLGRTRTVSNRPLLTARRIRIAVALFMVVVAASKLAVGLLPALRDLPVRPSVLGSVVVLVVVTVIANALRRGLPVAWWASLLLVMIGLGHAAIEPPVLRIPDVICWATLGVVLIGFRRAWPWRLPAGTLRRALPRLAVAVAGFVGLSSLLLWVFGDQAEMSGAGRFRILLDRATFAGDLGGGTPGATAVFTVTSWIWGLALAFLLVPVIYAHHDARRGVRGGVEATDRPMQELLQQHGGGSIGWQRTWPGFIGWTSADGTVAVSYQPVSGVAIALGDPVGPQENWPAAIEEFRRFCFRAGWTPAWYAVTDRFRQETDAAAGGEWHLTQIGEDAVLDLPGLEFKGKSWQDVRTARNHATKAGVRLVAVELATAPADLRAAIDEVSRGWVSEKALPEMGFTLGTIDHAADPEMRTHIALDDDGVVHGVTTWLPVHRDGRVVGWTLDVMRRRADGFRPVMEFLIAESALLFQAAGYESMSLSVAPLARRSPADVRTSLDRLLDRMSTLLEPAYGFRSLLAFKAKFHPRFAPVYLGYATDLDLAEISLAIGKAYVPHVSARQAIDVARRLVRRSA